MSSWLYNKLRRTKRAAAAIAETPPAPPCSPNRASYYVPSRERAAAERNPKLQDTRFPFPQQAGDIVLDRLKPPTTAPPELRLRPILTGRASDGGGGSGTSAAASPTARARPRFHAADEGEERGKPIRLRRRRVYESCLVVVKESADPEEDFLASMAEMMAANDGVVRSPRGLQDLLACYLALNAADHHRAIVAAFRRACWTRLHLPPTSTRGRRCTIYA
ncbi:hypothetical protein BS78_02G390500 [Paspalum vaginatum]|nr:hypothetical protein BS78_02G390500 [Paspalum vaginatum]